jgi:hypothetical protein
VTQSFNEVTVLFSSIFGFSNLIKEYTAIRVCTINKKIKKTAMNIKSFIKAAEFPKQDV